MNTSKMTERERRMFKAELPYRHALAVERGAKLPKLTERYARKCIDAEQLRRDKIKHPEAYAPKPSAKRTAVPYAGSVRQRLKRQSPRRFNSSVGQWMRTLGLTHAKAA